ncbi:GNAT family N-acetyltransferase [Alkalibacterium iburiense]|uniref:GNAT family N-acetyltransferase n=1 Tax=Alkalibacterium iburiense TaxID=290589 RepID=A0ABN0XR13_9LACT
MPLRKLEERDNQILGEIIRRSLEEHDLAIPGTVYYDDNLFQLSDYYKQDKAQYWVLEKEGQVIGGCGVGPYRGQIGEIQKLYIVKEEQGKGYAHLLMQQALAFSKEHYASCYIETFASLNKANRLYESYGFKALEAPLEGSEHGACDTWLYKEF